MFFTDVLFGYSGLSTTRKAAKELCQLLEKHGVREGVFVDMGSSYGNLALYVGRKMPGLKVIGFETNPWRVGWAKLKALVLGISNVSFKKADAFFSDLRNAAGVYVFLGRELMPEVEEILRKKLPYGAIAVVSTHSLPLWEPLEKVNVHPHRKDDFEVLHVYRKDKRKIIEYLGQ